MNWDSVKWEGDSKELNVTLDGIFSSGKPGKLKYKYTLHEPTILFKIAKYAPKYLEETLNLGIDFKVKNENGNDFLQFCFTISIRKGVGALMFLCKADTDHPYFKYANWNEAHFAALSDSMELEHVSNIDRKYWNTLDIYGFTPLQVLMASDCQISGTILHAVMECCNNVDASSILGKLTPLMLSCINKPQTAQFLLENGANLNSADKHGKTPLMFSCQYQRSIVELLLKNGAIVNVSDKYGWTPLIFACQYQPSSVEMLLKNGAIVSVSDDYGKNPLMFACQYQPSIVELLLKKGANVSVTDKYGWTPLIFTCQYQPSVVEMLLMNGANVNVFDYDGKTPLMFACQYQPSIIELLLKNGANANVTITSFGFKGKTPLMFACQYQPSIVEFVVEEWCRC